MSNAVKIKSAQSERALSDLLSHLTLIKAEKLLGPNGKKLIIEGGKITSDSYTNAFFDGNEFRLPGCLDEACVTIRLDPAKTTSLHIHCSACLEEPCAHKGAALAFILEEKVLLGLAKPPPEIEPEQPLSDEELIARATAERQKRAEQEKMIVRSLDVSQPWTDYTITNPASGKSYRVALRGLEPGQMFCSCPDFRKNTLGLCKHTIRVTQHCLKNFSAKARKTPWQPDRITVSLTYGPTLSVRLEAPPLDKATETIVKTWRNRELSQIADFRALLNAINRLTRLGHQVTIYPDASDHLTAVLAREQRSERMASIRQSLENHPLRTELLNAELLPYQLDGIAFAVGAGRAILADDMGLGKTIQGIGVSELLAREAGIQRTLVICPASLKSQWAREITKFCTRTHQLVTGPQAEREQHYANGAFFTICNYEQVLRDISLIERINWDLIILDEGQRIKNWEAKTTQTLKSLRSPFALVLTGTPLENRIDELFSVIEFIDERRLGPAFRFYNRHRLIDEKGKIIGYRDLATLRTTLQPILLRRTRATVLKQLPPRTTEILRIPPTEEQAELHRGHMMTVSSIASKPYLTEVDVLRLRQALLMARMSADSTFLVNKCEPSYSSKLERLAELIATITQEEDRKVVLFSEWTTMLNLIEPLLQQPGLAYVRLDGKVPQKKRQQLVNEFQSNPSCRFFLTTNAGSTGLNLQAANTIINVDLPWNPAILEQRIARAHRMGQKRPVQVYLLVTEGTIEENLLNTLSAKHQLASAALDSDSDLDEVKMTSNIEEIRKRLEILLGTAPDAAPDVSQQTETARLAAELAQRKQRVATASGKLLTAAFDLLGGLLPTTPANVTQQQETTALIQAQLQDCLEKNEDGTLKLTLNLPNSQALEALAQTLAKLTTLN